MRFKSVRFCSGYYISNCLRLLRAALFFGLLLEAALPSASATLWVTPSNGTIGGTNNYAGGSVYYFVKTAAFSGALSGLSFKDPTISTLDVSQTSATDTNLANLFRVLVTTDQAIPVTGNQIAVVTFTASPTGSGSPHAAPIAAINGIPCDDNHCLAKDNTRGGRYYAIAYPGTGQAVEVGFYPQDLCADDGQFRTIQGCNIAAPTTLSQPVSGTPTAMNLGFSVTTVTTNAVTDQPSATPIDTTSPPISFVFQIDPPGFSCPDQNTLNAAVVQPGDTQIFLNTSVFSFASITGGAPVFQYWVVGNLSPAAPAPNSSFRTANAVVSGALANQASVAVGGFTNTTANNPISYNIGFLAEDLAGVLVGSDPSTCTISGVQTGAISGFLGPGAKKCFIATAAYGSAESAPVVMLREFRDQVLLNFKVGRAFVSWYYSWSPPWAEWLEENAVFRVPVLLALAPLEIFAWICLHPFGLILLLAAATVLGVILVFAGRSLRHYES